jgi:hypothetical protein
VTGEICPKVDQLRRELAASQETSRLEADLVADRRVLSEIPKVPSVADPQSSTLSAITGIDEDAVRCAIAVLIAFLVEIGSALGFTLLVLASGGAKPKPQTILSRPEKASSPSSKPQLTAKIGEKFQIATMPHDLITRWALDRLDIVSSGMIQADDAFQDFREWSLVYDHELLTHQMFVRRFTKVHAGIRGRKVRQGGRAYYQGAGFQDMSGVNGKPKVELGIQVS